MNNKSVMLMNEETNNGQASTICRRCHKHLTNPESIIRGMGPICYGKSYTIRNLLKKGMTKEEIQAIPKEELLKMAREAIKKRTQKKNVPKVRVPKTKIKKVKKDKNQTSLFSFISEKKEEVDSELEELKKERASIIFRLSSTTGGSQSSMSDRFFDIVERIKKLEAKL